MAKLQLSFACGLYDRMQPLYTGEAVSYTHLTLPTIYSV